MLLPLFGLLFGLPSMLLVFGGLTSLAVAFDKHASKRAPITFAAFFAGLSFWIVLLVSGALFWALAMKGVMSDDLAIAAAALLAPVVGGGGGAVYGYQLGLARRRKYAYLDA